MKEILQLNKEGATARHFYTAREQLVKLAIEKI